MIDMHNIDALPSGSYRIRVTYRGQTAKGVAGSLEEAVAVRDELRRQIIDNGMLPTKGVTAKDLRAKFLGSRNANRDVDNDTSRWQHIAASRWYRTALPLITRIDGQAWLKWLKKRPVQFTEKQGKRAKKTLGWQTRKHCLNLARAFFDWAIDEGCYGLSVNPFLGLTVEREDGDEDEGYQEGWYLDPEEQQAFFGTWDRTDLDLDNGDRWEKWIAMAITGTGMRKGEAWCLHLADVHVGQDVARPFIDIRFGSWDPVRERYRAPKGRKGEKKSRRVFLHGLALEAFRTWLKILPVYCANNPLGLCFPTERGKRRRDANLRSWPKVVEAFGIIPRIGRKVWMHLLRHTCASSLVSGWWGMRWSLEEVCKVLGHTDVRTTQVYAHLAPSAMEETAKRAHAAYLGSCHGVVTAQRAAARSARNDGHARRDSNPRHSASKAGPRLRERDEVTRRDNVVTAIRHVLQEVAAERLVVTAEQLDGLELALHDALRAYARAAEDAERRVGARPAAAVLGGRSA